MNRWFGPPWAGAICETPPVDVPVGKSCLHCEAPIEKGDRGIITPFHGSTDDPPEAIYHPWGFLRALGLDAQRGRAAAPDAELGDHDGARDRDRSDRHQCAG